MEKTLSELRHDYGVQQTSGVELHADPVFQLKSWLADAMQIPGEMEPNAMTLATVNQEGQPSARIVLLKDFLDDELVFFTNYESRKGYDLEFNPRCSCVFWWRLLFRQVRIEGTVSKTDPDYSTRYFNSRPLGSQLGAIVSPQSKVIPDRDMLDRAMLEAENRLKPGEFPLRPDHWGGYRIRAERFEFWQGQTNRLHDRFLYTRSEQGWDIQRLAP